MLLFSKHSNELKTICNLLLALYEIPLQVHHWYGGKKGLTSFAISQFGL